MNREEAIKIFQLMKKILSIPNSDAARTIEAIDMAIEALSAEAEKTYIGIDIPYGSDKGIATIFKRKDDKLILEEVKELMRSWIPCSERLPKEGQMVLTTIRGHDVIISQDGETLEEAMERVWNEVCYVSVGFIGSDGWYGADGFPQIVHPIAWMPLPDPYTEMEP